MESTMRAWNVCSLGAIGLAASCTIDIFHSTHWPSRCVADPDQPDCEGDGGEGGGAGGPDTGGASSSGRGGGGSGGAPVGGAAGGPSTSSGGGTDPIGCADGQREGFADATAF